MFHITSQDSLNQVMTDTRYPLILLDIYADWCVPCKLIAPKLEAMVTQYPNVHFCKLNAETGLKPVVTNLPTIEFWQIQDRARVLVHSVVGANMQEIVQTLQRLSSKSADAPLPPPPPVQGGKPKSTNVAYKTFGSL